MSFITRRNKKNDLTEFYKLLYEYKNDCLTASMHYNKEYYQGNNVKPFERGVQKQNSVTTTSGFRGQFEKIETYKNQLDK